MRRAPIRLKLDGTVPVKVADVPGVVIAGVTIDAGHSEHAYEERVGYRMGDMWAPVLDITEALRVEGQEFIEAIEKGRLATVRNSDQGQGGRLARVQRRHYGGVHKTFPGREISTPFGASNGG